MAPDLEEWEFPNRATPLGSPAYYAVRFSPPRQRRRNALLLAWQALIEEMADRPHDPGVARVKLDWWRNEIASLEGGAPRHPLLAGLRDAGLGADAIPLMRDIVDSADTTIRRPQPVDDREFADACRAFNGPFFELLAGDTRGVPGRQQPCREAGGYCAAVGRVQRLAERPGRLPDDAQPRVLRGMDVGQRTERIDALLQQFAVPADARRGLPDMADRLTALAVAIHRKMRRKGYPVHDTLVDRPPIAHLWTAWRAR